MKFIILAVGCIYLLCGCVRSSSIKPILMSLNQSEVGIREFIISKSNSQDTLLSYHIPLDSTPIYVKVHPDLPFALNITREILKDGIRCEVQTFGANEIHLPISESLGNIFTVSTSEMNPYLGKQATRNCIFLNNGNVWLLINNDMSEESSIAQMVYLFGKDLRKIKGEYLIFRSYIADGKNASLAEIEIAD